jgi:MtN3 and saliva related transmembrane protein
MQMSPEAIDAVGMLAGTLTTISFLPQLVAVYRTKSAHDISYGYLLTFAFGVVLWLSYGILLRALPIILANAITLTLIVLILGLKIRYRRLP